MYFVYLLVVAFSFVGLLFRFKKSNDNFLIFLWWILFLFLGTFAFFSDDYEPYERIIDYIHLDVDIPTGMEPFWVWFMGLFNGNIDLFRFCTFFIIGMLIYVVLHILNISNKREFFCYYSIICLATQLNQLRQAFAFIVFIIGLCCFIKRYRLVGIVIIFSSMLFHKSMGMMLALLPFIFIPLSRKWILLCLVMLPVSCLLFNILVSHLSISSELPLEHYLGAESAFANRHFVVKLVSSAGILVKCILIVEMLKLKSWDASFEILRRTLWGILYIAIVLFFVLPGDTMMNRYLSAGYILLSILLSQKIGSNLLNKKNIHILFLLTLTIVLQVALTYGNNHLTMYRLYEVPF